MTNEPGFRMIIEKLNKLIKLCLKSFNVSLGGSTTPQPRSIPSGTAEVLARYGEEPLKIGNELMITVDIVKTYKGLSNAVGRVVVIDQMPSKESSGVKASAFGIQVKVGICEAQEMRAAYLAWQQT